MEKLLEVAWVGPKVGWGRISRNHQGRVNGVSHIDGDSGGGLKKEQWLLSALLSGRKLPLQSSPKARQSSSTHYVPGAF